MEISGTLCGWRRLGTEPRTHTLSSSFPCQSRCVGGGVHNVPNLRWYSYGGLTFCCPQKITLMHLSKGLTHTSSVAMVWGHRTIARGRIEGKGTRRWIKGSVSLERQALCGICLFLNRSADIPNQHLVGMSLKKDSVNVFQISLEHVAEWGICFLHVSLSLLQGLIRSPVHKICCFFHFLFLYKIYIFCHFLLLTRGATILFSHTNIHQS